MNIIISLNGQSKEEIEKVETGFIDSIPWTALMPVISQYARLRPYEQIEGLILSDTEVRVKISRKRGRERTEQQSKEIALIRENTTEE